jgi:hypothetical protein
MKTSIRIEIRQQTDTSEDGSTVQNDKEIIDRSPHSRKSRKKIDIKKVKSIKPIIADFNFDMPMPTSTILDC